MPYSGCIEKNQVYFFVDPVGKFKNPESICRFSYSSKSVFPACPFGAKKIPCTSFHKNCMQRGDKICEHPALYCDMFCSQKCREVDEEKSSLCYTTCKLACMDEKKCPYYMSDHCNHDVVLMESYTDEQPTPKTISPPPTTVTPFPSTLPVMTQLSLNDWFFKEEEEPKKKDWTMVMIIIVSISIVLLIGFIIYYYRAYLGIPQRTDVPVLVASPPPFRNLSQNNVIRASPTQPFPYTGLTRQRIPGRPVSTALPVPAFRTNPYKRK